MIWWPDQTLHDSPIRQKDGSYVFREARWFVGLPEVLIGTLAGWFVWTHVGSGAEVLVIGLPFAAFVLRGMRDLVHWRRYTFRPRDRIAIVDGFGLLSGRYCREYRYNDIRSDVAPRYARGGSVRYYAMFYFSDFRAAFASSEEEGASRLKLFQIRATLGLDPRET